MIIALYIIALLAAVISARVLPEHEHGQPEAQGPESVETTPSILGS
jgi:hypothetical protein